LLSANNDMTTTEPTPPGATADEIGALRLVCGLGNPGEQYRDTRHNVGFRVVEELARRHQTQLAGVVCKARTVRIEDLVLAAPLTFMNRSGFAVRCLAERLRIESQQILVVYDEIHLSLGRLRLRRSGSPAGHRGLESILENLGTDDVPRLRLGVGLAEGPPAGEDWVDFVLSPFAADEQTAVDEMIGRAADACQRWAEQGAEAAMQAFNS
jgi:PTH1 family peptidyl-tRNA hydrolase